MPADGTADVTGELRALIATELPDITDPVELAHGGFGVVFKAKQPALSRDVAVKVLSTAVYDERVRLRFERECMAMGMLSDHPSILTVFDAGFTRSGRPYLVMDLMTGGSLADRLEPGRGLPYTEVLPILVKVASALETAHRAGVLHRDIKPENIMVSAYGEPQLGDFGIARLQGAEETKTESLTASIAHVSPELLGGEPPSISSDVYALGSTAYMLLAGSPAFVKPTDTSIIPALARIAHEPVPDLRQRGVPDQVAAFVERLMAKDPGDRPATAEAVAREAQALEAAMGLPDTPVRIPDVPTHLAAGIAEVDTPGDIASAAVDEAHRVGAPPEGSIATEDLTLPAAAPSPPPGQATVRTDGPPAVPSQPGTAAPPAAPHPPAADQPAAPAGRRTGLIAAAVAAVLIIGGVIGVVLLGGGDPDVVAEATDADVQAGADDASADQAADEPDADATPTDAAGADADGPDPEPDATPTEAQDAGADGGEGVDLTDPQLVDQVATVRELPAVPVTARGLGIDAYRDVMAELAETSALGPLAARGQVMQALGVLPPEVDLATFMPDLYAEQFLGLYDPLTDTVVLRTESADLTTLQRSVLATEMVPALLDAQYDIGALRAAAPGGDGLRALAALVDGDTIISAAFWTDRFLTPDQQAERDADFALLPDQIARSAPASLRADLVFPFTAGNDFVRALFTSGGLEALDAAYANPPTTTEQVLHPDKYLAGEPPLDVAVTAEPGEGWDVLLEDTFGEFDVRQMTVDLSSDRSAAAGDGWGGGTMRSWTDGSATAVAIALRFDTPEDAVEACQALGDAFRQATGAQLVDGDLLQAADRAMRLRCDGDAVSIGVAPDAELATALADGTGP